jgi:hypothetical protein
VSRRFPGAVLTDWRSRLLDAHPRLFPDARPLIVADGHELVCSGRPAVGDGWRRILETACRRIEKAIAAELGEVALVDVKQKYGTLRCCISTVGLSDPAQLAVELAIDLAEARSAHVCEACGESGRLWNGRGWYHTACDDHGEGSPVTRSRDSDVEVSTRFVEGRPVRSARRYVPDRDCFVAVAVPAEPGGEL